MTDHATTLKCGFGPTAANSAAELCTRQATWHIWWDKNTIGSAMSCHQHLQDAKTHGPADVHPIVNSACGIPGAAWSFEKPISRCVFTAETANPEDLVSAADPSSPFVYWPAPGVRFTAEQVRRMEGVHDGDEPLR